MENYIEYLQERIRIAEEHNQLTESKVLQECLDAYLSFLDAATLRNKTSRVIVIGEGPRMNKAAQFAEMYGTVGPAAHIMIGSKEMHDNIKRAFSEYDDLSKNGPIQGRFEDIFSDILEPERGITINQSIMEDISFRLTRIPEMTAPLIPLDKYGKPLENSGSKFHK